MARALVLFNDTTCYCQERGNGNSTLTSKSGVPSSQEEFGNGRANWHLLIVMHGLSM